MDIKDVEEMANSINLFFKEKSLKEQLIFILPITMVSVIILLFLAHLDNTFSNIVLILIVISIWIFFHDLKEFGELKEKIEVQKRMIGDEKATIVIENKSGIGWFWKILIFIIALPIIINIIFGISIVSWFF